MVAGRYAIWVGLAMILCSVPGYTQDRSALIAQGQQLFFKQGCYGCHTVGQVGTPIGPDLSRVGAEHSLPYLTGWLRDPASQKRSAHMPKIELAEAEIQALAMYLATLR